MNKQQLFDSLIVVKRSGQRTSFQGEKIAIAIQKAFTSIDIPYKDEDVNKVYSKVLIKIEKLYQNRKTINIENIQDIIEETLKEQKFTDVYQAFSTYREQRNASRKIFVVKQQHKFLKAIESLGLNNLEEQHDQLPKEMMNNFGRTIAYEFAKAYLLDTKTNRQHDSGTLYIHSIATMPMGSIDSLEIDLTEIEHLDTPLANELKRTTSIFSYLDHLKTLIYELESEQYGSCTFCHFDKDLIPIYQKQWKQNLKKQWYWYLNSSKIGSFFPYERIEKELDKPTDIEIDQHLFQSFHKNDPVLVELTNNLLHQAEQETQEQLTLALTTFFQTLSKRNIGFNFGTATSKTGKTINRSIIATAPDKDNLHFIFKVKKGLSLYKEDENFGLLQAFEQLSLTNNNTSYAFLDSHLNSLEEEVCYLPFGSRVIEDTTTLEKKLIGGKGNLATVSLNIVRIALKHQQEKDLRCFYQELDQVIQAGIDALLERFELQCSKHSNCFPYLYAQGVWHDGEKIKDTDRLRKLLKHGTLTIHLCGFKEMLNALTMHNTHDNVEELGLEIITFIRKKIEHASEVNNLNFTLSMIAYEQVAQEFKSQDTAIFGKVKGVTDHAKYKSGLDKHFDLSTIAILQKETNGGHLFEITPTNIESLRKTIENFSQQDISFVSVKRK